MASARSMICNMHYSNIKSCQNFLTKGALYGPIPIGLPRASDHLSYNLLTASLLKYGFNTGNLKFALS